MQRELLTVEYYDHLKDAWTKVKVAKDSNVMKALNGEVGGHFDTLREHYRLAE